jgi:hypothetical protein
VWKTLLVQSVGTDRTIGVVLVEHGGSHLYKDVTHVKTQKRATCQMVQILAAVNKKFITKNLEPQNFSNFTGYSLRFLYTVLVFKC